MTAQDHAYPRVELLINTFGDWLKHRRELNEIRQMDRSDFDRIAGDLRVSPNELDELVRKGPHAADELPKMLKALGIDEAGLARTQPLVLCHSKGQCDRDLAAGTAAEHYEGYCLNAPTIELLNQGAGK
jgi:transcriptional regulator with XRE-family HTH domain